MNLHDICTTLYFPSNLRIRHKHTKDTYRYSINNLAEFVGNTPSLPDLTDGNLIGMMSLLLDKGLAPRTVNNRRTCIIALWEWCARKSMVTTWPTVPPLEEPKKIPRGWNVDQLAALIKACKESPGYIGDVRACDWWLGFHGVIWDTSERTSATLAIKWEWLSLTRGSLYVPATVRKGRKKDALYQLMEDTLHILRMIKSQTRSELVFPGIGHESAFWKRYDTLLKRAGLPVTRWNKPQKMRISHASHLKAAGGDPTASLMHSSDAITRTSYLDPSICDQPHAAKLFRILPGL